MLSLRDTQAERRFDQCLAAKKAQHGDDSIKLAETYNNMAINYKKAGKVRRPQHAKPATARTA